MTSPLAARLESAVQRRWHGRPGLLWLLWPLELLFRALASLRRLAYARGWRRVTQASIPVVVVGNITVGGTGKTPVTLALCQALQQAGFRPGIASRGYGSSAEQFPLTVTATTPAALAGDEPLLLARRTGLPVVIAPRRADAVAQLAQQFGCDVAICDDGLQHYALARDIEWVVIDGRRGFGNGHCLPLGPLREPRSRLAGIDALLVNGGLGSDEGFGFGLIPTALHPLRGGEPQPVGRFTETHRTIHAVAGIGHPQRFFDTLRDLGLGVIEHPFPDHHRFTADDLAFGDGLPVVMTEKDAVKCADLAAAAHLWYLAVDARLPREPVDKVIARLRSLSSIRN